MKKKQVMNDYREMLRHKIHWEGFDSCFRKYSNWLDIHDTQFHKLRVAYVEAANALDIYIGPNDEDEHQ